MPRTVAVPILAAALLISLPVACTGSTKPAILPKEGEFVCARISCQNTIINILRHQMVVGGRMRERQLRVVRGKDPTLLCTILCISDVVGTDTTGYKRVVGLVLVVIVKMYPRSAVQG